MNHLLYRPGAPLDRLVDFFWVTEDAYVARAPRERVLPTGSQALIVHLGRKSSSSGERVARSSRPPRSA